MQLQHNKQLAQNTVFVLINKVSNLLFPLVSFLLVTRRMGAENYGLVCFCDSVISYFILISSLGIENYAIRECVCLRDHQTQLNDMVNRLFTFNIYSTGVALVGLALFIRFAELSVEQKIILGVLALKIVFGVFRLEWIFKTFENYLFVTVTKIVSELVTLILVVLLVKTPEDYLSYAFILTASTVLNGLAGLSYSSKYVRLQLVRKFWSWEIAKPVLILFANLAMVTIYLNSDITMLGLMQSNIQVGQYRAAGTVYSTVKEFINAICMVAMPRIAHYLKNGETHSFQKLSCNMFRNILLLVLPTLTGLFWVGESALALLLGEEYRSGAAALKIMCFALFFATVNNILVNIVLLNYRRELVILKASLISAIVNIGLNLFLIPWLGIAGAAFTTLIAEITVFVISYVSCSDVFSLKPFTVPFGIALLGSGWVVAVCRFLEMLQPENYYRLALQVLISAGGYALIVTLFRARLFGGADTVKGTNGTGLSG